jgi:hypothetical protein
MKTSKTRFFKLLRKAAVSSRDTYHDYWLAECAKNAGVIIAAWGNHGNWLGRADEVVSRANISGANLHCLRRNKDGSPCHPLYLPKTLTPIPLASKSVSMTPAPVEQGARP